MVPEDLACDVYKQSEYHGSTRNLDRITLETDNVFSDGWDAAGRQPGRLAGE